jgi:predicted GIY-YIG superfamily endonuclease
MVTIYCIEDINDLKYVGSTTQKLKQRFTNHISDKRCNKTCSSRELNLENSIIYPLEECSKEDRREREKYWINKLDCVNVLKLNYDVKEYDKMRNQNNERKEKHNKRRREKRAAKKLLLNPTI